MPLTSGHDGDTEDLFSVSPGIGASTDSILYNCTMRGVEAPDGYSILRGRPMAREYFAVEVNADLVLGSLSGQSRISADCSGTDVRR